MNDKSRNEKSFQSGGNFDVQFLKEQVANR